MQKRISYLIKDEQTDLIETIQSEEATPSLAQAQRMRKLSESGELDIMGDRWENSNRIFIAENGAPMGVDSARHWLSKFCKRNGLKTVNVHSFRHLNASLLISSGVDVKTVSAALGHSQTSTTLNIYAHSFQEQQARASETIANALPLKPNKAKQA